MNYGRKDLQIENVSEILSKHINWMEVLYFFLLNLGKRSNLLRTGMRLYCEM